MPTTSIAEIRQKYPQYSHISDTQLADALHKKHYSHLPKADFYQRVGLSNVPRETKPKTRGYSGYTPVRTALQGATLGFGDELQAGIAAATAYPFVKDKGFKDLYKEARGELRGEQKAFADENPLAATGLEVGGGLLTGGVGATRAGAVQGVKQAAKYGGKLGLLGGAGYSEADTVGGLAKDTAIGGATGLGLGVGGKYVGEGVKKGIQKMLPSAEQKAGKQVLQELQRAGMSVDDAKEHLRRNPDLILGDLSDNLQQRTASVSTLPGRSSERAAGLLNARNRSQLDRITPAIREGLGNDSMYLNAVDELQTSMKTRARPLYEEAYNVTLAPTDKMRKLTEAVPKEAFNKAKKLAKSEMVELDFENLTDTKTLDYLMRGLSDIEGKQIRGGANQYARSLGNIRRQLTDEIDQQNPAFKAARDVWSGGKADEAAIDLGKTALKADSEALASQVKKMSESELKHFRIGVMKAVENSVEGMSVNRDLVKKFRDVPRISKALRSAFKDEASYNKFMSTLDDEAAMFETFVKAKAGSRTTPLAESNAELKRGFFSSALKAMFTGGASLKYDAATSGVGRMLKPIESKNERIRGLMGDMLLSNKPDVMGMLNKSRNINIDPLVGGVAAQGGLLSRGR